MELSKQLKGKKKVFCINEEDVIEFAMKRNEFGATVLNVPGAQVTLCILVLGSSRM